MPYAARVGDMTSHGTPLGPGPGSPDVMIGGQPAWCAEIDLHACPLANGPQPHVGGTVEMGSLTVMINEFAAARQGDAVVEAGGPNSILAGYPFVLIGG